MNGKRIKGKVKKREREEKDRKCMAKKRERRGKRAREIKGVKLESTKKGTGRKSRVR